MATSDGKVALATISEAEFPQYFGEWLKRRREELHLTQIELAGRVCCTVFMIRKIETGDRRPSKQLAELLAQAFEIPSERQATFIKVARGELSIECLHSTIPKPISQPAEQSALVPGNLPKALTPFVGREAELSTLGQLLHDPQCSLVTIVGPGGIGKTRLAIEAASNSKNLFPDGIWFVPLAALNSPVWILQAIADALDFKFQDPTNPQTQLFRYLQPKKALLVLDNAEHLLDGVGLFTEILKECQHLKLFVTSRERLNLVSEWVFEVAGLPVPPDDQGEQFEAYSSVALFLQSARRVQSGFQLSEGERSWVLKICQIMEGMPLGIELSAAWVGLLPCQDIAREIEHNLGFLSVSMRDLPARHRSLRASLDYSWSLINTEERSIFSRLSVFQGNFRREAAQEICAAHLPILSSLRDKTLLYRAGTEHYALHELIRQYAELKLSEDPCESKRVRDRHASYYVHCLSEWEKGLQGPRQLEIFDQIAQEIDNLSQAWRHMITHCRPTAGTSSPFCADLLHSALFSLSLFYEMRCRSWEAIALFQESVEYLKTVQPDFEETEDSSRFNSVLGHITAYLGYHHAHILQYKKAREYLEEAIQLLGNSHSWIERAQAQIMLGSIDYRQGQYLSSAVLLEQSRDIFRQADEGWWHLLSIINLARTYFALGKLQEGEALCQEGFQLAEMGDVRLKLMLRTEFAYGRYLQKDYLLAEQLMVDNLQLSHQYGNRRVTANIDIDLSKVVMATRRIDQAIKYLQESIELLSEFGDSDDLAYGLLHLGKCFLTQLDLEAAHQKFRQAIKIGHALDMFYLVYWGLVCIARIYQLKGQTETAVEILLVLRECPVEYKEAQDEADRLLTDLKAGLPERQVEAVMKRIEDKGSRGIAIRDVLAHELQF